MAFPTTPQIFKRMNVANATVTADGGSGTADFTQTFRSMMKNIIITPDSSDTTFKFQLLESDDTVILDRTTRTSTGRTGIGIDIPLVGIITISITSASVNEDFAVKIYYL